jgi:predicted GIY-YIG superfamily endonuclease
VRILARACVPTRSEALRAEHALKQLPRAEKLRWCDAGLDAFVAGQRAAR